MGISSQSSASVSLGFPVPNWFALFVGNLSNHAYNPICRTARTSGPSSTISAGHRQNIRVLNISGAGKLHPLPVFIRDSFDAIVLIEWETSKQLIIIVSDFVFFFHLPFTLFGGVSYLFSLRHATDRPTAKKWPSPALKSTVGPAVL